MRIHALSSQPHYRDHIDAVLRFVPDALRGEHRHGHQVNDKGWPDEDIVVVAGAYDIDRASRHRLVYVEHGAGQSYGGCPELVDHPNYHGGLHPERVIGYICPRPAVAGRWQQASPHAYAIPVGCPITDRFPCTWERDRTNVAAITFHFPAGLSRVCPEMGSALDFYTGSLGRMVDHLRRLGFTVVGTAHPRVETRMEAIWRNMRVPMASHAEVLAGADLVIGDNSSLLYEAANLGIAVGHLNAPQYRRDVEHGLRFWDQAPGLNAESGAHFCTIDWWDYVRDPMSADLSMGASIAAYAQMFSDSAAGMRAAAFLTNLAEAR